MIACTLVRYVRVIILSRMRLAEYVACIRMQETHIFNLKT
jgi:hypothetical protein